MSSEWPIEETGTEYECPWFTVGYDDIRLPDGKTDRFYWIDRPKDAIAIVAVDGDSVVMVEQYRPRLSRRFLECPGGHIRAEETPYEAAARELREETGYVAGRFDVLTRYAPVSLMRYERSVVIARDLDLRDSDQDETEFIETRLVSTDRALELARTSPSTGWTLTALLEARVAGFI